MGRWPLIAIPLTAVRITQSGREPVIADSCTAILYNAHQAYAAEQLLDNRPEQTIFLVPDEQTVRASLRQFDERAADDPARPMRADHARISAITFAQIRRIVATLQKGCDADSLEFEEALTRIAGELIGLSFLGMRRKHESPLNHRDIAHGARKVCLKHFAEPLGLEDIAQAVGASRFHLCRVFRAIHGRSIHQYLTELRLRASLEMVCDRTTPLARIALASGFSSQSHFTTAFLRRFGHTPAAYRRSI